MSTSAFTEPCDQGCMVAGHEGNGTVWFRGPDRPKDPETGRALCLREIRVLPRVACIDCNGTGKEHLMDGGYVCTRWCPSCAGSGYQACDCYNGHREES